MLKRPSRSSIDGHDSGMEISVSGKNRFIRGHIFDLRVRVAQTEINRYEEKSSEDESGWGRYHEQTDVVAGMPRG